VNKSIDPRKFRMPAEWEEQSGVWLQWPHEDKSRGYQRKLESIWLEITDTLKQHVTVDLCIQDERRREYIERQLQFYGIGLDNIRFYIIPTNDIWIRDNGPTFVIGEKGELAAVNWVFNGWGGRYPHSLDKQVPRQIARELGIPLFPVNYVMEGGNIEVNGQGDLICARSATLNDNRNPGVSQETIEEIFRTYLGAENIIWLPGMKTEDVEEAGWSDDTDTHIDTIVRFVNPDTIVYSWVDSPYDRTYPMLKKNYEALKEVVLASGKRPNLVPLPIPEHGYYSTSRVGVGGGVMEFNHIRTDASYTNFLISNGVVLVPTYGNVNDERAIKTLQEIFSDREVVGINCGAVAENGGEIHCFSQQMPYGKIKYLKKEG